MLKENIVLLRITIMLSNSYKKNFHQITTKPTLDELIYGPEIFGNGDFLAQNDAFSSHQSSSTEDLILLFQAEKEAAHNISQMRIQLSNQTKLSAMIDEYLSLIDYNM